ncbi:MAG TPA: aminoglycoside phosphotransferase family protein [Burkholderiaceae bacterium]|nr:aminoglycoside phosphotransferase family protein [Burkholderiaceae bacterium]HQR77366.1 aminoglycoside phosphotransferase family protein [Burkholderiaceae bacterium]
MAVQIDDALVRCLVAGQFPQWSELPIRPVTPSGWDNRIFRLGDAMLVRLPSGVKYAEQVAKEQRWLPYLAKSLPLAIPTPLALGQPSSGYPWNWSVYRWLEGEAASAGSVADLTEFASSLGHFLCSLQRVGATGGPEPGPHNFHRGGTLGIYNGQTRQAIAALEGKIDGVAATAIWEAALARAWNRPPVWVHGDVSASNLLVRAGRLSAVIDFGQLGVGDPACDLAIAWTFLEGASRRTFRDALSLDDETWARGRGWALWKALIGTAGLVKTTEVEAAHSRRTIDEVLADVHA